MVVVKTPKCCSTWASCWAECTVLPDAEACARKALALDPNMVQAHVSLGMLLKDQGKLPRSAQVLREAIDLCPTDESAHSCYLFCGQLHARPGPLERFAAYQRFNQYFGEPHRRS